MDTRFKLFKTLVDVPKEYELVSETVESRNKKEVTIIRYQKEGMFMFNGPRIIGVLEANQLVSFKNYTSRPAGSLLSSDRAKELAESIFSKINPGYARGLTFLRLEHQSRSFIDENGNERSFPVQWIKFAHRNGSYNWVTLGNNGVLIEMETESLWDYFRGRRKTEMWDNDDWVAAREGTGPQLPSPNALA